MPININHFLDLSSSLLCIVGFDGYFKHLSPAWEQLLGYSLKILRSKPYLNFVHADDIESTRAEAERLIENQIETLAFENRYRCKNGTYIWLKWNVVVKKEHTLMYCVAHDITSLKKNQLDLKKSNYLLQERIKELNGLLTISSFLTNQEISVKNALRNVINRIPLSWQYSQLTCARIILHDNIFQTANFKETIWKLASNITIHNKKIGSIEIYYLEELPENDEGPFLKEERDLINGISKMIGEFCLRSDSALALRQSEEKYRVLAEHTGEGVIVIQENKLQYINKKFANMLEFNNVTSLMGKEISDFLPEIDRPSFFHIYSEIKKHRLKKKKYEGKMIAKSGRLFWIEAHFSFAEWLEKPCIIATIRDIDKFRQNELAIKKETDTLKKEYAKLKSKTKDRYRFDNIIGKSPVMQELYELITEASATDTPVVILGESGTGKEEVARTIHNNGERKNNGFVPVNCGAIPDTLFESEFFGYKKGAFTGAFMDKHGFFDLAHKGTLFMDEVGELNLSSQVKLLRTLENGEYTPIGDNTCRNSDARIISATNSDISNMVEKNKMREDFFYRIHVLPISLPPLRDRKEDIPLLADYFLEKFNRRGDNRKFSGKEIDWLCDYTWPGNIRELQNVVLRYVTSKKLDFFGEYAPRQEADFNDTDENIETMDFRTSIQKHERRLILRALEKNCWHKEKAASMLGLPRRTFFRKLKQLNLKVAQFEP